MQHEKKKNIICLFGRDFNILILVGICIILNLFIDIRIFFIHSNFRRIHKTLPFSTGFQKCHHFSPFVFLL